MIVSKDDFPVFDLPLESLVKRKDYVQLHDFILHASLDAIESMQWNSTNMYMKTVDRFNELSITCLLTPSSKHEIFSFYKYSNIVSLVLLMLIHIDARFLLLHENKNEDAIKNFFNEVYELFVKVIDLI